MQEGMPDMQDHGIATCNAVVLASIVSPAVDGTWIGEAGLWRTEYKREELCSNAIQNLWITEPGSYADHLKTCTVFGGHLVKKEATTPVLVKKAASAPKKCIKGSITRVSWLDHDLQEDSPLNAQCPVLLINGTIGSHFCIGELECSLCRVSKWMRFTLYGAIYDFDRFYFLRSLPDGNFHFEGLYSSSLISLKGNSWVLSSHLHRHYWQLTEGFQVVGRHSWHSGNSHSLLTLTSCTMSQFSSDEGYCLPRNQRCNSLVEFADGSDEEKCLERTVEKGPSYESILPPSHKDNAMINVYYAFHIKNIKEITTKTGVAKIDIQGVLQWADSRLQLRDIGYADFTIFNCNEIWHPKLGIRAGYMSTGEEINFQVYTSECIVAPSSNHRHYAMDDPYMGRFVHGKDDNLTMYMHLLLELPCNFELHRYPFGFHQCNATFYLKSFDTDKELKPLIESGEIKYDGNTNLLDYQLLKTTFEKTGTYAMLTLHLKSQCDYHILNSFSPSALMFIISYATLFFPLASTSDRIMVSLTALLVLAALFAQASGSYVKTPYYKLIDIWYAIMIGLCFTVVMVNMVVGCLHHTPVYRPREGEDNSTHGTLNLTPRKVMVINVVCKGLLVALFVTWVTIFALFATNVI
ncbi:uncharacterized protein [Procambarus clarkii]|uniref:uncharacterized protein n=1 Tax=Procambarus clarkii TaxID=6728 RepID=UPI00374477EF